MTLETEGRTGADEDPKGDVRRRTQSEKGRNYSKEIKGKGLQSVFQKLKSKTENIKHLMAESQEKDPVQVEHAQWISTYTDYYRAHDEYCEFLDEQELAKYKEETFDDRDVYLQNAKQAVEVWLIQLDETRRQSRPGSKVPSVRGSLRSRPGSTSSCGSSKFREKQNKAGLTAKMEALKEKHNIMKAKLQLSLQEEELELKTQLAVAEARFKVAEQFEGQADEEDEKKDNDNVNNDQGVNVYANEFLPQGYHKNCKALDDLDHCIVNEPCIAHDYEFQVAEGASGVPQVRPKVVIGETKLPEKMTSEEMALSIVRHLRKPHSEIKGFSGDVLDYNRFVRQFNSVVATNSEDVEEQMNFLEQYTAGEANRIVTGYSFLPARQGLAAAWKELEDRYGDTNVIANAYIQKAVSWPNIKADDPQALDDFGIFLSECEYAVRNIRALGVLDYSENLKRMVRKLPFYMHDKWRNVVQQTKDKGKEVKFSQLAHLVKAEAKKANDSTYGRKAMLLEETYKGQHKKGQIANKQSFSNQKIRSYATSFRPNKEAMAKDPEFSKQVHGDFLKIKPCPYCLDQPHTIEVCPRFKGLSSKEKVDFVKRKGLCFGCLKGGHLSKECRSKSTCQECRGRHPTLLHFGKDSASKEPPSGTPDTAAGSEVNETGVKALVTSSIVVVDNQHGGADTGAGGCAMAIIPIKVKIKNSTKVVETYAFLDPGSSVSFCTDRLIEQIGGSGPQMKVTLDTMGTPHVMLTRLVTGIEIYDLDSNHKIDMPRVYTKREMPVTYSHIPTQRDLDRWPHLNGVKLSRSDADIGMLIGINVPDVYAPLELRTGPTGSPYASRTRLGWVVWGITRDSHSRSLTVNRAAIASIEQVQGLQELDRLVKEAINFDFPEREAYSKKEASQEDKLFLKEVMNSIHLLDGHYHIKLPFKEQRLLPDNRHQALLRLHGLEKRMAKNPQFSEDYIAFMGKVLEKGFAEPVPKAEQPGECGKVWYLPHHGVYHPKKPGKIRVVFDCAATYQGVALNKLLLQGPDLTNKLQGVLLRFRQEPIAIMADIEAMFSQVKVPKEDCDYMRFFWWPGGDLSKQPVMYRMVVHLFGAVSSPACSNVALHQTVKDNKEQFSEETTATLLRNFYVDDCLKSVTTVQAAMQRVQDLMELCQKGGFRLTKWISNSREVLASVPEDDRAKEVKDMDLTGDNLPTERALGVSWFVEEDTLGFRIQMQERPPTRRGILSIVSSVYDPIGLAAPFVLSAKRILQDLCRQGKEWDEEVDGDSLRKWQQWQKDLPYLEGLSFPRCYKPATFGSVVSCQIHSFSDASEIGYGMVSYIRFVDDQGKVHCSLLTSKSRVVPLKKITMPRLELTAATLAVSISNMIVKELDYVIDDIFYWTDSQAVLRYIKNESTRFQTFVANRIARIRDGSEVRQWNYINTSDNPADDVSRGLAFNDVEKVQRWVNGPEFLSGHKWPTWSFDKDRLPENDPELKKNTSVVNAAVVREASAVSRLLAYFSDWFRLRKAVGWWLVMRDWLRQKVINRKAGEAMKQGQCKYLNLPLLERAEQAILCFVQRQHFAKELLHLEAHQKVLKSSSIRKLDPFMKDGLLRVGGRLSRSVVSYNTKYPIILPKDSTVTRLLIQSAHSSVGHLGRSATLSVLRERHWILHGNAAIKVVLAQCVTCKKHRVKLCEQQMADLPKERVTPEEPPFTRVGMDFFGPFLVKQGRSSVKRYGVIFTCLAIRAVHLEVAHSLDTDSCVNSIRRFVARRGQVKYIRSDNGTNIVGAQAELKEEISRWNQQQISNALLARSITWEFNPPGGSHFGGVWERMIRTVRKILFSLLKENLGRMNDESLQTLFCEVEAILNARPITAVPNEANDLDALTPNHLLLLRTEPVLPVGVFQKEDNYVRRRWRQVQYLADLFWKRWVKEYLPSLQERQKWTETKKNVAVGDIALVVDSSIRSSYTLGRVVEVVKDPRGLVREVLVKTPTTTLRRPVAKLCIIVNKDEM